MHGIELKCFENGQYLIFSLQQTVFSTMDMEILYFSKGAMQKCRNTLLQVLHSVKMTHFRITYIEYGIIELLLMFSFVHYFYHIS